MFLWCASCYHAHLRVKWAVKGEKYGVCPTCGSSEYRNAVDWSAVATANDYPIEPDPRQVYELHPVLF